MAIILSCVQQDMGFERPLAEEAVRTFGTVQSSLEALLAGKGIVDLDCLSSLTVLFSYLSICHSDGELVNTMPLFARLISRNMCSRYSILIGWLSARKESMGRQ